MTNPQRDEEHRLLQRLADLENRSNQLASLTDEERERLHADLAGLRADLDAYRAKYLPGIMQNDE